MLGIKQWVMVLITLNGLMPINGLYISGIVTDNVPVSSTTLSKNVETVSITPVEGDNVSASSFIGKNDSLVGAVVSQVNSQQGVNILEYNAGTGVLTFNNRLYSELDNDRKQEYMSTALKAVQGSDLNAQRKSKMYNFVAEQDTTISKAISRFSKNVKADSAGAFAVLSPFQRGFSLLLGVIVIFTLFGLIFSLLLDLVYLTIPFVSLFANSGSGSGEKRKPWFVSDAAVHSLRESENSVGSGAFKNSVVVYIKTRTAHIFVVILLSMLLITGGIYRIVGIIGDSLGF